MHSKPLALGDHQPLIGVEIAKFLDPTAGPAHDQPIDLGGPLQAEVGADVAVRQKASPRGNLADLDAAYAGFHGLARDQVAGLYDVMQDGYQCHLRMHLHVAAIFQMAMPLLLNGYHTDAVGAAMMARLGRPDGGVVGQLATFEPLIAKAARRTEARSRAFVRVQSTFALNYTWLEHRRDDAIPRSLSRMFRHMAALRLRLMWTAGIRSWLDPVQIAGLLNSLIWAVVVRGLGRCSLKRSRLARWLFAPGRDDARSRIASSPGPRPEFNR